MFSVLFLLFLISGDFYTTNYVVLVLDKSGGYKSLAKEYFSTKLLCSYPSENQ